MENKNKIKQLETQLIAVLSAYNILEEYSCLLVGGDIADNQTISEANKIISEAFNPLVINYRNNQNK